MDELNSILNSVELRKFPEIFTVQLVKLDGRYISRKAWLECPKCRGLDNFYNTSSEAMFSTAHCPGGLPPEVEHSDILGRSHTHLVSCSSINVEHFHVMCKICDHKFLLAIPGAHSWEK